MARPWPPAAQYLARAWLVQVFRQSGLYPGNNRFGASASSDACHVRLPADRNDVRAADDTQYLAVGDRCDEHSAGLSEFLPSGSENDGANGTGRVCVPVLDPGILGADLN